MATEIIEKIAKLRRLATSTNIHEAAAAAAAADRLMQEHGIAEAQLEAAGEKAKENPTEEPSPFVEWVGNTPQWQMSLATQLARHYGCSGYVTSPHKEVSPHVWKRSERYHVVGRPSDIASARYMYTWLILEIERLAALNKGNGKAWINSFKHGAVSGVLEAMRAEKAKVLQEAAKNAPFERAIPQSNMSAALVLIDNRLTEAKAERDRLHPNLRKGGAIGGASTASGYSAGQTAGRRLGTQHKGLATGASGRALKG